MKYPLIPTIMLLANIVACGDYQEPTGDVEGRRRVVASLETLGAEKLGKRLVSAARIGNRRQVMLLIAAGADTGVVDKDGNTALMAAASRPNRKNVAVVRTLLKFSNGKLALRPGATGINWNATNHAKKTALMYAAESGHLVTLKALINAGADVNATSQSGETALIALARNVHGRMKRSDRAKAKVLIDAGIDIDAADTRGMTALMHAVEAGNLVLVKNLTKIGANYRLVNKNKQTALDLAQDLAKRSRVANRIAKYLSGLN